MRLLKRVTRRHIFKFPWSALGEMGDAREEEEAEHESDGDANSSRSYSNCDESDKECVRRLIEPNQRLSGSSEYV